MYVKKFSPPFCSKKLISPFTELQKHFIKNAINEGKNILISGGTGSGKTQLLQSCLEMIPEKETVATLKRNGCYISTCKSNDKS